MRAGQVGRQLDLAQGGRGRVPASGKAGAALRGGGDRHVLRRARVRPTATSAGSRSPAAPTIFWSIASVSCARTSSSIRTCSRSPPASRSTRTMRSTTSAPPRGSGSTSRTPRCRAESQRFLQLSRKRSGARGDPYGVPVSRHSRRTHDGHRQRRAARRVRRAQPGAEGTRRGRGAQSACRRHRAPGRFRRELQGARQTSGGGPRVAPEQRRGAPVARAGEGHRHVDHRGHRGGAPEVPAADPGDRRAADGGHERRRRPVRGGQDVPAAGRQERARDEAGRRAPRPLHRSAEGAVGRDRQAQGHGS